MCLLSLEVVIMPNGGSDNCGTCGFNSLNSGQWQNSLKWKGEPICCTIRKVTISNPFYTYCDNWHSRSAVPSGPVFVCGLYEEGNPRIPCIVNNFPLIGIEGVCDICGKSFENGYGITIDVDHYFCTYSHYMDFYNSKQNT